MGSEKCINDEKVCRVGTCKKYSTFSCETAELTINQKH